MQKKLDIVFMGTPDFSVSALVALVEKYNVVAVYTKEPKPVGRKMLITKSPVQVVAEKYGIPVYTPKNFRADETVEVLRKIAPDMIVVSAYGLILPQNVLDIPRMGCINIHASLLPKLRGANPIQRAILNGDKSAGITIMRMDAGMDTGDMLLSKSVEIDDCITYGELEDVLSKVGAELILQYIENRDSIVPVKQPEDFTLALKLKKEEAIINWADGALQIHNLVRGLQPYPSACFSFRGNVIKLIKSRVVEEKSLEKCGTVVANDLKVVCGDGKILQILELQKLGGKPMKTRDFLNGCKVDIGEVLG